MRAVMKRLAQLLILATFSYFCRAQCSVNYTEQPPITLDCSPYLNQQFRLRIWCTAMTVTDESGDFDLFDLYWYRRRSHDGVEENLGTGNGSQEITSRYGQKKRIILDGISELNLASFSEEMPGDYWCQAVITNSSGQYLLTESNVLTVLRPENYTALNVCTSVQSEDVTTCASAVQLLSGSSSSSISPPLSLLLPSLSLSASPSTMIATSSQSCKSPVKTAGDSSSTPSTSASSVPEGSNTDAIIIALVGVMVALLALLLLLMAGITITLFLRRKASSKAIPTAAPLQDQAATRCSDKIHLENHYGPSPQPVEYEQPISLGLSQHPQAMAAENPSDSHIIYSMVYETKREHHQTPQKDPTYSHLEHVQTSCDVSNGGQESQYSKLNHHKKELCDHSSQKQGLSSQSYELKNKSCIFDDQQYAEPFPSGPR